MSRLHEAKVDEKRWIIIETDNKSYHTYKLVDKEKDDIYFFRNIIGLEQVGEDEFLVFDRYNWDEFRISRYKAENSKLYKLFEGKFNRFHFITDDKILFMYYDNSGSYHCCGIYSIKNNDYVEDGKWLKGKVIGDYDLIDGSLYVEEEIVSYKLGHPKLLFTVDPNELQPNSDCYSELRDSFRKVNSKEDIEKLIIEEKNYIRIIEGYMYQQEDEQIQRAKEKILAEKNLL